jgi:hypothetical protein
LSIVQGPFSVGPPNLSLMLRFATFASLYFPAQRTLTPHTKQDVAQEAGGELQRGVGRVHCHRWRGGKRIGGVCSPPSLPEPSLHLVKLNDLSHGAPVSHPADTRHRALGGATAWRPFSAQDPQKEKRGKNSAFLGGAAPHPLVASPGASPHPFGFNTLVHCVERYPHNPLEVARRGSGALPPSASSSIRGGHVYL